MKRSKVLPCALPCFLACLALCRFALAVPAYDAQPIDSLPTSASARNLSQFNNDGAFAYSHYDDAQQTWITGIWVPRPLYGHAAGYTQLFTWPVPGIPIGVTGVWPMIDNAGSVTYYSVNGGSYDSSSGPIPYETLPNWNDANVINTSFAFRGILGWATSDPAPYAGFVASVSTRDGNIFQPTFTNDYSGSLNAGMQVLARPAGDFGSVEILNRLGHQIWIVQDARTDLPGRVRDSDSTRTFAVTAAGTTQIAQGYFLSGRGDVTFATSDPAPAGLGPNTYYILLAGPLGSLGPGLHIQSSIPGMPVGHQISKFNSAGTFIVIQGLNPPRILNGGKSALLSGLLPPVVPQPRPLNQSNVISINEAGMLTYVARNFDGNGPLFLLTPTIDCDVTLGGTQPYRMGEEFDLDVTVHNVAGAAVTDVRVEGNTPGSPGISVGTFPAFDIIGGPTPATPLTLNSGATQVIRYRCRSTRSGVGEVTAKVKGTAASGNALRTEATAPIEIEVRGDLLVKRTDEPAASFALDDVYQRTAPAGAQDRREPITAEGAVLSFDVKVQNDEDGPLTLRVSSLETGSTAIPARYFQGATDITDIIKAEGWTTPVLAAGASVTLRVDFGPTDGAVGGEVRAARLTLQPADGGGPCDIVHIEAANAPPVEVTLRRPSENGLTPQSVVAGKGNVNASLVFTTDTGMLHVQSQVTRGLVADGVTPLLLEMRVPPDDFAGFPLGITYNVALEVAGGGTLNGTPAGQHLRLLKNGTWQSAGEVTFTESQNVQYASITPVPSDDLQITAGMHELQLRLRFTQPGSGAFVTDKIVLVRRPPIALVHGYNTNGDWGSYFGNILGLSRGVDFVKTIRYGQDPPAVSDNAREATTEPFTLLAVKLETQFAAMRAEILADGWAMTRHDVVAHSQGGVLSRMLCSSNGNAFMPLPFRNPDNNYRGRFHRVVTIGSPHNGTRLVSYMSRVAGRLGPGSGNLQVGLAGAISSYMISSGNSQPKFDPFGPSIRLLNSPDSTAPWYPDSGAMFHLVQTTVNDGLPPSFANATPSEVFLGLNSPSGALVLPRGSDGVVDFDSMTATTPEAGQEPPANSYRMHGSLQISHALVVQAGVSIFGGTQGQTDSDVVASHVIGALDQLGGLPPEDRVFGPFRLAIPLSEAAAEDIDLAASQVTPGLADAIGLASSPASSPAKKPAPGAPFSSTTLCQFNLPPDEVLAGPVAWSVERYGVSGLTGEGVALHPSGDPGRVVVEIDHSYLGDVVLYGTARTVSGLIITGAPFLVESTLPDSETWELSFIEVEPSVGSYPVGAGIGPELWETWSEMGGGEEVRMRRFLRPEDLTVVAVPDYVVDVSDPLLWKATSPGSADVLVTVQGVEASSRFTVYQETSNGVDHDGDGRSSSDESGVPNRSGVGTGDGNGDGAQDQFQAHVASVRGPSGKWFTLATDTGSHPLFDVTPQPAPADTALLPEACAFDYGFVGFTVYGLSVGASTIVTLFLPANHEVATLWAWGPEPGMAAPHWFEFIYDGQTGGIIQPDRIELHITDGGPGDADGVANGVISTVPFGLARFIPQPPAMGILSDPAPLIYWPVSFPNSSRTILETSTDLSNWNFQPDSPLTADGQNFLFVPSGASRGFFRLRSF